MNDSQPKSQEIGLAPDKLASKLTEFVFQYESADKTKKEELLRRMTERVTEMIEKDPENRDKIISRLWIITSDKQKDASRLILQTNLIARVLYLITDPKRKKDQETEGTRRILKHVFGEN